MLFLDRPHCNSDSFVKKSEMQYGPGRKFTLENSEISPLPIHFHYNKLLKTLIKTTFSRPTLWSDLRN